MSDRVKQFIDKCKADPRYMDLAWMDAPIKSEKWKNLHFNKGGGSYVGKIIHKTELAAKIENLKEVAKLSMENRLDKNYSHTIQIPWKN